MATSTIVLVLFVVLITSSGIYGEEEDLKKPISCPKCEPCNLAFRCSFEKNPVWATDGSRCFLFVNECHFLAENCNRRRDGRCDPLLKKITQENCQDICKATLCTAQYTPLCGYQSDTDKKTFSNNCNMYIYNCLNVTFYSFFLEGECP